MRLLKKIIKRVLNRNGYEIIKISPPTKREIYNAYYLGDCFKCIKGDPLSDDILLGKIWDSQIPEILKTISKDSGIVIEIGANIGTSILPHTKFFPELNFKLYEPVPVFYNLLIENHKIYNQKNNVEIINTAFGAKEDEEIEINVGLGTAGKTKLVHYQMIDSTLTIKAKKLDSYFENQKISLIKLDVDGHELSVLKGGQNILTQQHPLLFIEFAPRVMDDINQMPEQITDFLMRAGYNQIKIWDHDSQFIKTTNDWNELIKIGRETPHYLNILVSQII